jgi:hypothetical protein
MISAEATAVAVGQAFEIGLVRVERRRFRQRSNTDSYCATPLMAQ